MARSPTRIPQVLAAVEAYWSQQPWLRLGQVLCNMTVDGDPYYLEDDVLLARLMQALDRDHGKDV